MRTKKTNKKSKFLFHRIAKFHIKALSFLLILYLVLGAAIDPRFLAYDFRQKYSAIAASSNISVSLRVMGQPGKPTLTATADWLNGISFIELNWNQTEDTTTYDVYRNSLPLITGLTENVYRDTNIEKSTFYDYKILAKGPMGETFSDEIHIFSGDHEIYTQPTCQLTIIGDDSAGGMPKITDRTPFFSGTTNIKNAIIEIVLNSKKTITGTTYANINGYWSWNTPEILDLGMHHIHITATDPENSLISTQGLHSFEIVEAKEIEELNHEKEVSSKKSESKKTTPSAITTTPPTENPPIENAESNPVTFEKSAFKLLVSIGNTNKSTHTNDYLIVNTKIITTDQSLENKNIELHYIVTDEKNNSILDFWENSILPYEKTIQKKIYISDLFPAGKYKVSVRAHDGERLITGEDFFQVKEYNLINIGGTTITLSQIMQGLSWIILLLAMLILFFLFMLALEKYLASKAKIQITEYLLAKKGYFGKRKGVQR